MRPIIGILGSISKVESGPFIGGERTMTGTTNVRAILRNGGMPVVIPPAAILDNCAEALSMCQGFLFPGGADMTPWYYGEEPDPKIGPFQPQADQAALMAGKYLLEKRIPMLGICKGHQTLNVLMGGSLYQDLSMKEGELIQHFQRLERSYLTHHVVVEEGTRLSKLLGAGTHPTNSMHHQAVKRLGDGLVVSARAVDGTVEAIEDREGLIVGIQWHPEDLVDSAPEMNAIFVDLIERAKGN